MKPSRRDSECLMAGLAALMAAASAVVPSLNAGDREKAQAAYREGNGLFDQGQFSRAAAAYNDAIAEDPQFAQAYHNLALASEMVDRNQAIEAWKRFVDVATGKEEFKFDVARIHARLQILQSMPALPESMSPHRYVPEIGDYYWQISRTSEGEEWGRFPVRVFLGSAPEIKWQQGAREAFDSWASVFPLELVAIPEQADIRMSWEGASFEKGQVGEETEWVQIQRTGEGPKARRIAVVRVDLRFRWSKDDMRAIVTHELGHALGIKGHSDTKKDIMYWEMKRTARREIAPGIPFPEFWRSLVKNPSQRDINTLIRLYNHAGSSVRFR
jgi:predicted Zn-dependent protease